jgi:hypothetical protein
MKKTTTVLAWIILVAAAALAGDAGPIRSSFLILEARAADSCTNWMPQPNGCSFRTCVDDKGKQYCEQACGRNTPTRVSCK